MDQIMNEGVMLIIIMLAIIICCIGLVYYFIVNRAPVHEESWEEFFQIGTHPDVNYRLAPPNQGVHADVTLGAHTVEKSPSEGGDYTLMSKPKVLEDQGPMEAGEIRVSLFNKDKGEVLCLLSLTKQNREFAFQAGRAWEKSLNMGGEINITVKLPSQVV